MATTSYDWNSIFTGELDCKKESWHETFSLATTFSCGYYSPFRDNYYSSFGSRTSRNRPSGNGFRVTGLQGFIKTHPNLSCCNEHGACFFCVQYSKNELCFSSRLQSDRRCKYFKTRLDKHSEKQIYVFCSTISKYVSFQGTLTAENFDVLKFISGIQRNHSSIPYEIHQSKI